MKDENYKHYTYRLFIDDERDPPNDGNKWIVARTSEDAKQVILERGLPRYISFDHDLGGDDTSMVFIKWLIEWMMDRNMERYFDFYVHSQNTVGRNNIVSIWRSFDKCFPSENRY